MLRQFLTGLLRLMIRLPKELFSLSGSCSNHRFQWLFPELWRSGMYSGTSFFRKMHSQKRACISGQQSVFRCGPLSVWRAGAVLCLTATGSYRICTCFPGQSFTIIIVCRTPVNIIFMPIHHIIRYSSRPRTITHPAH